MFGAIPPRVYFCRCGWKKYVNGSRSDVLVSAKQLPPAACEKCAQELSHRAPHLLERLRHGSGALP